MAPRLWRFEVANALTVALRRKRIDVAFRDASLTDLATLLVAIASDVDKSPLVDNAAAC